MNEPLRSIDELFDEGDPIDEALRLAARDARVLHKKLGLPMATWQDGKVVWIPPEDLDVSEDAEAGGESTPTGGGS